tara:strand:+ start:1496 stop:1705 length:210 start_codon:yes stop_codon:yes gene_type:complete
MLDVLLVTMSLIAVIAMFFLCYITYTLNEELKHNDDVINQLQNERDSIGNMYRESKKEVERLRKFTGNL